MKIKVKNLGALKQAEFTLGDLTIICGYNNTGKTYATYALFGFLYTWRRIFSIEINDDRIEQLLADGVIRLDIQEYVKQFEQIVAKGCQAYTQELPKIFAASAERFKESEFLVKLDNKNIPLESKFDWSISFGEGSVFSITKSEDSTELVVTLVVEKEKVKIPDFILKRFITDALKNIIFVKLFPRPFIASSERTGAAIFRKDLNFDRNRLLEDIGQAGQNMDRTELLLKDYGDYALPIKTNVDFIRRLETIVKKTSFIAENHPDVLDNFADIIGGEYTVTRNDELYYQPKGKRVKLSMDESSSAVRSLLDIGFYLRHEARPGDLLMVDEPELNLHPENQRRVARLFSRLVNLGIKVFITTHSDYIIKELNTLIMLNHDKPHLKRIAETEGYQSSELISAEKIKVYIAEEAPIILDNRQRKQKFPTLTSADINPELGIEARSFDKTIETMNRIQEAIVWGED
jgi:predicted ATPase